METKKFYLSKTFWLNVIGLFWILFAGGLGLPTLNPEMEMSILAVLNLIVRFITKQPIGIS